MGLVSRKVKEPVAGRASRELPERTEGRWHARCVCDRPGLVLRLMHRRTIHEVEPSEGWTSGCQVNGACKSVRHQALRCCCVCGDLDPPRRPDRKSTRLN